MSTDAELLQRYAGQQDNQAFAELVQRHLGFVYATAHRSIGGRADLAEEIAQKVFTDLARKSASICHHPVLVGWLYRSARLAAMAAIRAEFRRQKITQTFALMPDVLSSLESPIDWERLRPVLDEVLEELKERDREIMLLRFFEGLSFVDVGARLNLSENAARMRLDRALDQLRLLLKRRGITSTSAALGLLLGNQVFAAAPLGTTATVTAAALAATPATSAVVSFLLVNKFVLPAVGAVFAIGLTAFVWAAFVPDVSAEALSALRGENARLVQADAIVQTLAKRLDEKTINAIGRSPGQGLGTPHEALLAYGRALEAGDTTALRGILTYTEQGRASIETIHAGMPASIRVQYPTPEELIAFFFVADTLRHPPLDADVLEQWIATETSPERVVLSSPARQGAMNWVRTAEGWKCVVPDRYPEVLSQRILGNEMAALLGIR